MEGLPIYDINVGAYLELNGIPLKLEKEATGRVVFKVQADQRLFQLLKAFEENEPVGVKTFAGYLKNLRTRMLVLRDDGKEQRGNGRKIH
jgi:hypothetical protein